MDNVNYSPRMLLKLASMRILADEPFMLFDIGCGLGIDPAWRLFGDDLQAHGFDAQEEECARLEALELNPNVHYHAALVGLPPDDAFHDPRSGAECRGGTYFDSWAQLDRSSSLLAGARSRRQAAGASTPLEATEQWRQRPLSSRTIGISAFASERNISNIDFVKIDTDGRDLEVAVSSRDAIRRANILGFMVECFFTAPPGDATRNSFHNVDGFMREQGFVLYGLSVNRYSRAALPAPFLYRAFYQTISGQPIWGDMIYLRDAASTDYAAVWDGELAVTKLLKLACLYELFRLPDCAAELILAHRNRLKRLVDPSMLLDLLTPQLDGVDRSHHQYLKRFEDDPESFFPA
jgi:hypothetical protein